MAVIYIARNTINSKVYIGLSTISLKYRKLHHESESRTRSNNKFHNALKKYGSDKFEWFILEECDDCNVFEREKHWISKYNSKANGYNSTDGGEGTIGYIPSEETRRKISAGNKGKIVSKETREKISHANRGVVFTEERKMKISSANKGRICTSEEVEKRASKLRGRKREITEEHRHAIKIAQKGNKHFFGKKHSEETKAKMSASNKKATVKRVVCINDGIIYNSLTEAAAKYNLSKTALSNHLKGRSKSFANMMWKYYEY